MIRHGDRSAIHDFPCTSPSTKVLWSANPESESYLSSGPLSHIASTTLSQWASASESVFDIVEGRFVPFPDSPDVDVSEIMKVRRGQRFGALRPGELTPRGLVQHYMLGRQLRGAYGVIFGCAPRVAVVTTNFSRTLFSAAGVVAGLGFNSDDDAMRCPIVPSNATADPDGRLVPCTIVGVSRTPMLALKDAQSVANTALRDWFVTRPPVLSAAVLDAVPSPRSVISFALDATQTTRLASDTVISTFTDRDVVSASHTAHATGATVHATGHAVGATARSPRRPSFPHLPSVRPLRRGRHTSRGDAARRFNSATDSADADFMSAPPSGPSPAAAAAAVLVAEEIHAAVPLDSWGAATAYSRNDTLGDTVGAVVAAGAAAVAMEETYGDEQSPWLALLGQSHSGHGSVDVRDADRAAQQSRSRGRNFISGLKGKATALFRALSQTVRRAVPYLWNHLLGGNTCNSPLAGHDSLSDGAVDVAPLLRGGRTSVLSVSDSAGALVARVCHGLPLPCTPQPPAASTDSSSVEDSGGGAASAGAVSPAPSCLSAAGLTAVLAAGDMAYAAVWSGGALPRRVLLVVMRPFLTQLFAAPLETAIGAAAVFYLFGGPRDSPASVPRSFPSGHCGPLPFACGARVVVFAGHDTGVAPVLRAFGLSHGDRQPPYAASLVVEVFGTAGPRPRVFLPSVAGGPHALLDGLFFRVLYCGVDVTASVLGCRGSVPCDAYRLMSALHLI